MRLYLTRAQYTFDRSNLRQGVFIDRRIQIHQCVGHIAPGLVAHVMDVNTGLPEDMGNLSDHVRPVFIGDRQT